MMFKHMIIKLLTEFVKIVKPQKAQLGKQEGVEKQITLKEEALLKQKQKARNAQD